ncbi:MAG: DUF3575 domain-containing protein [Cyclobacteriaceae bacterium]
MKKLILSFAILTCSLAVPQMTLAQENNVKINIFSPLLRTLNLQYERALNENSSFQLGFFYTGASIQDTRLSGFGITPEYRFYLSETDAPEGFYLAPYLRYSSLTGTAPTINNNGNEVDAKATVSSFGGGLVIGKQWIFKERIVLNIFAGPSYSSSSADYDSGNEDNFDFGSFSGFSARGGVCLGIAF